MPNILTLREAAELLAADDALPTYKADYLKLLIHRGELPAEKLGRDWTISEAKLRQWARRRIKAAERQTGPGPRIKTE